MPACHALRTSGDLCAVLSLTPGRAPAPRPHASNVRAPTYSSRNEESECSSHHGCLHFSLCPPPCACLPTCPPPTRRCRLDEGQQTSSLRSSRGRADMRRRRRRPSPLSACASGSLCRQPAAELQPAACHRRLSGAVHANVSSRAGSGAARQARRTLCDQPMRKQQVVTNPWRTDRVPGLVAAGGDAWGDARGGPPPRRDARRSRIGSGIGVGAGLRGALAFEPSACVHEQ